MLMKLFPSKVCALLTFILLSNLYQTLSYSPLHKNVCLLTGASHVRRVAHAAGIVNFQEKKRISTALFDSDSDGDGSSIGEKKDEESMKFMVGGLNLFDPQDILTVVLVGVIVYNTIDIAAFYIGKLGK
mmetsp:Transcript_9074/g.15040  ORF Transcript_9074/g.15040 Transcript_9074/m.15040 type:complete len:129 (-) Transcript_9074:283-669(-)